MIPTPFSPQRRPRPEQQVDVPASSFLWVDQLSEELLLTVQALQRLHAAFDQKFTGGHPDE